jgi:RND family efflux transporter MFP subunit
VDRPRSILPARLILPALVVLVLVGGAAFALANRQAGVIKDMSPAPAMTVTSAMPRSVQWSDTFEASGAIAPWQEAIVGTQIGGYRLIDVRANVGDRVKKGQLLAAIDADLLRADLAQLQATWEEAEVDRERALKLKSTGAVSEQEVLQLITRAKRAAAALEAKHLELRYTKIVAPDDGTISSRTATVGAVMPVGQELFRLIRADRLEWRGELTSAQLARVRAGLRIQLKLPDGSEAGATVRQIAPALDPQSRLGIVYADLEAGSRARAGMYASGSVVFDNTTALVVPAESVVIRDGRNYVVALDGAGATPKVSLLPVTVGRREGREVEVARGIGADQRVVVRGAGLLNDGDVVRVMDSSADSPPALANAVPKIEP